MRKALLAITAATVLALFAGACGDDERNQKMDATTSPQEFFSLELPSAEVRRIKDGLLVTYDLDPSMWTGSTGKTSFNISLAEIVPKAFYKFHDVNSIMVTATASFRDDIRGHSRGAEPCYALHSRGPMRSRLSGDRIAWDDLPLLADEFWQHPRLIKTELR